MGVEIRVFFSDDPPKGNVPAHIRELAFRVDVRKLEVFGCCGMDFDNGLSFDSVEREVNQGC